MYSSAHTRMHTHIHTYKHIHTHTHTRIYTHAHTYSHAFTHELILIYMCIYKIHIRSQTHTHKNTNTQPSAKQAVESLRQAFPTVPIYALAINVRWVTLLMLRPMTRACVSISLDLVLLLLGSSLCAPTWTGLFQWDERASSTHFA